VSTTYDVLYWKRFADLRTTSRYIDLQEVALDINTVEYNDNPLGDIRSIKRTKFLSARPLKPISATELFKKRYD
jgi:hypothetical protein